MRPLGGLAQLGRVLAILLPSTFGPSMRSLSAELPERGPLACAAAGWIDWQAEGWPLGDPLPDLFGRDPLASFDIPSELLVASVTLPALPVWQKVLTSILPSLLRPFTSMPISWPGESAVGGRRDRRSNPGQSRRWRRRIIRYCPRRGPRKRVRDHGLVFSCSSMAPRLLPIRPSLRSPTIPLSRILSNDSQGFRVRPA